MAFFSSSLAAAAASYGEVALELELPSFVNWLFILIPPLPSPKELVRFYDYCILPPMLGKF